MRRESREVKCLTKRGWRTGQERKCEFRLGPEPVGGGEKIGTGEVGGDEGNVGLTVVKTGEKRVGLGDSTPRVVKERGNGELGSPDGGGGDPERSGVGAFGEMVGEHGGGREKVG